MPMVTVSMFEGRTLEQKRAMVKGITEAIADAISCDIGAVQITIYEVPRYNVSKAGVLVSDMPTGEAPSQSAQPGGP